MQPKNYWKRSISRFKNTICRFKIRGRASFKLKPIRTVDFRKFLVTPTLVAIPSET